MNKEAIRDALEMSRVAMDMRYARKDEVGGGGGGIEVGDVTEVAITTKHGRALITWTDPDNVVYDGATLARWAGTLIVRKAGSIPASKTDGVIVVDNTTRNAYASAPYTDSGLTDGTTYYYRFFPHTTGGAYTSGTTLTATPEREVVNVPVTDGQLAYTGSYQTQSFTGYDNTKMTISGDTGATDVGTYTSTFVPAEDYKWPDGSTAAKNVTWTVSKAAGSISFSETAISLDSSTLSDTFMITRSGDGAISVSSSDTSIATVTLSGTTVTVDAVATGSAVVTVSVAADTNYEAATKDITITVSLAPPVSNTLNDNSWDVISQVALEGTGDTYWDIGDCKEITLNGKIGDYLTLSNEKLCVFILDFNHKMNGANESNIIFGCFKSALTDGVDVALCDSKYGSNSMDGSKCFNMNHKGQDTSGQPGYRGTNYGGWKGSDLRYDVLGATLTAPSEYNQLKTTANVGYDATAATLTSPKADTFLAALPSDLRSKIRLWTRWVDAVGNASDVDANIKATVDAVTLLAEPEIFASRSSANQYEYNHNTRMAYYAAGNGTVKKKHSDKSTAMNWWECSPSCYTASAFCSVNSSGGANSGSARSAFGLAPAFKI